MTTRTDHRPTAPALEELILVLVQTADPHTIAVTSDQLGAARDRRAVRPLLMRLGDCIVESDPDVEVAVCRALVSLDVMRCSGDDSFSLRPRRELAVDVVETVRDLVGVLPWRYFGTRQI